MPVILDPDLAAASSLAVGGATGAQIVSASPQLMAWLAEHPSEYAVVIGPRVPGDEAYAVCNYLRTAAPTTSVVLVRDEITTDILAAAMQAGARDVVLTSTPIGVTHALDRAQQLSAALRGTTVAAVEATKPKGKVYTVWSPKGGVGKTTVAVNLGLALSQGGANRVCLVDLDLAFGDVAITMQLFPTHSIEHAVGAEDSLDADQLNSLLTRHSDAMTILAAPTHPDVRDRITPALVSRVLQTLRDTMDYVVVDTAPTLDEQTLAALDETDELVLVATLDVPTLKNVKIALETLDALNIASEQRHLLLNRADDQVGISADRIEGILGLKPEARVGSSIDVAAATNAGAPIVLKSPHHPASRAIQELAAALTGKPIAAPEPAMAQAIASAPPRRLWKRR